MKRYDSIIAIDPDVNRSGVALLKPATRRLEVSSLTFPQVVDYLRFSKGEMDRAGETLIVVVEASWLIRGNWHLSGSDRRRRILLTAPKDLRRTAVARAHSSSCSNSPDDYLFTGRAGLLTSSDH